MLDLKISTSKNLLAFSGGVDSSALFYLLLEKNTPFDIAIVDYSVREESKLEVEYAKNLAKKYNKRCFIKSVTLDNLSNFEKRARDIRYDFFEKIIDENSYESLLTAHQLNDSLEWFLMQLSKGAGLAELMGLKEIEKRDNYTLFRPLLNISKDELQSYLDRNSYKYFIDKTNFDKKYKRNKIRDEFASKFISEFKSGVQNSFKYLKNDLESMSIKYTPLIKEKEFELFNNLQDDNLNIRVIDKSLKKRGLLLTKSQRDEILLQRDIVISHKISVSITKEHIWIAPYKKEPMQKEFKEKCRVLKVPKNIRSYLFTISFNFEEFENNQLFDT